MLNHSLDFTAGACTHWFAVKGLPEVVDGVSSWLCTSIDQDTNVGIQDLTKGLEKPSVRIDLLLVLLLQAEEHLDGGVSTLDLNNVLLELHGHLCCVFVDMCRDILAIDFVLCDSVLVDTKSAQNCARPRIDLETTIAHDTNDNLLPSIFAPSLAGVSAVHILNVLYYADHCAREQYFVFIVHRDHDEQFCMSRLGEKALSKRKSLLVEVGRIASSCSIAHMCEFVSFGRLGVRDLIEQSRWDRAIENEITIEELDLLDSLPAANRRWRWLWPWLIRIARRVFYWIRAICCAALKYWPRVAVLGPVLPIMRRGVLVLIVVCIVVRLRIEGIVTTVVGCWVLLVVSFIVSIAILYSGDRILYESEVAKEGLTVDLLMVDFAYDRLESLDLALVPLESQAGVEVYPRVGSLVKSLGMEICQAIGIFLVVGNRRLHRSHHGHLFYVTAC